MKLNIILRKFLSSIPNDQITFRGLFNVSYRNSSSKFYRKLSQISYSIVSHVSYRRFSNVSKRRFSNFSYRHGISSIPLVYETIGTAFRKQVEKFPDRQLFSFPHQNIRKSYAEAYQDIENLAKGLIALGLKRYDRVAVWAPNCYEWVTAYLATAMAGMILVCINPANQAEEVQYCLNKVQCKALIFAEKFKTKNFYDILTQVCPELPNSKPGSLKSAKCPELKHVIILESAKNGTWNFNEIAKGSGSDAAKILTEFQQKVSPDDAVNIQFTSGTTGSPKAATLSHHGTINTGFFLGFRLGFDKYICRVLLAPPLHHIFGNVCGILAPLMHGGMICLPSPTFQALPYLEALQNENCNTIYGTPTMYIDMIGHPDFEKYKFDVRLGIMGGAPCPGELRRKVMETLKLQHLTIGYGLTETSPIILTTLPNDPHATLMSQTGGVAEHVEVKIVDSNGHSVPIGHSGELWTRGFHVMHGYWDDEKKTREVLGKDRWFRTGDTAVMNAQGFVSIVGRQKDMIIRGGENIYPAEVENFLHEHPKIADVHVFGVPDERMGEEACCWIRLKNGTKATEKEIKDYCKGKLAHFKIPRYFAFKETEDFPLTSSGKVQKYKLKELAKVELGLQNVKSHMDS